MNKAYSILAASAIILAGAADFSTDAASIRERAPKKSQPASFINTFGDETRALKLDEQARNVRGLRKADADMSTLEGTWTLLMGDYYFSDSEGDAISLQYNATLEGTTVTFTPVDKNYYEFVAEYDPEERLVTIDKMYLGVEDGYRLFQDPFVYDYDTDELEYKPVYGDYSVRGDLIKFDDAIGIAWNAYNDDAGTKLNGPFDILDVIIGILPPAGEWVDLGMAMFTDGWLLPATGANQMENAYEVPIQRNSENENLYRLVNPYKYGPMAKQNSYKGDGYIIFDVSDPDHVAFLLSDAGYANSTQGFRVFFPYNTLGLMTFINPLYDTEDIIAALGAQIPPTTFKDGIVLLNQLNNAGRPDARFGIQYAPLYGTYWGDDNNNPINMTASIVFPEDYNAVEAIGAENNATVEYYNLQGVRVSNPEAGQILIKRTGNKTEKVAL